MSYRKALAVYDGTRTFCRRFLEKRDRTYDQMGQAARPGKQNIAEGSRISGTSKEGEIKLTNVVRASLEELLKDYGDILRTNGLRVWDKDSREAMFVRRLGRKPDFCYEMVREFIESRSLPVVANILISLIHQANYLLGSAVV